jgi:hypothetical protein
VQVTEKFPGDSITSSTIIYGYAETGTAATKSCPMKTYGNHNYSKTKPIINTAPICNNFTTETNSYSISNYTSTKYTFAWRSADGTLLSTKISQLIKLEITLTVTDLSIFSCSSDPVAFTVEEISSHISHLHYW